MAVNSFKHTIYEIVAAIPEGRLMTYGDIAGLAGHPYAARQVGGLAHFGPTHLHTTPDCKWAQPTSPQEFSAKDVVPLSSAHSSYPEYDSLRASFAPSLSSECEGCGGRAVPWHRVVNRLGECAAGYYGGKTGHQRALEAEGFTVQDFRVVDFKERRWRP